MLTNFPVFLCRILGLRDRRVGLLPQRIENKEIRSMLTNFPVFHAEYWVYAIAALVIVVMGTLLYTVDAPIKFSSWF